MILNARSPRGELVDPHGLFNYKTKLVDSCRPITEGVSDALVLLRRQHPAAEQQPGKQ